MPAYRATALKELLKDKKFCDRLDQCWTTDEACQVIEYYMRKKGYKVVVLPH